MGEHNPPPPGEIIRAICIEPLNLTVTDASEALCVSIKTLSGLLDGRSGVSPEMALRLSKVFGRTPEEWIEPEQAAQGCWVMLRTILDLANQKKLSRSPDERDLRLVGS